MAGGGRVRRRLWSAGVLALVVLAALAGCGVPDSGDPVVVSTGQPGPNDNPEEKGRAPQPPPNPSYATDPIDLVRVFFQAAAADPDQVGRNVPRFFTSSSRDEWRPDQAGITVVRITSTEEVRPRQGDSKDPDTADVRVSGRRIGVLNAGSVNPLPAGRSADYSRTFHVVRVRDDAGYQWLIDNPPAETLMSTDALDTYFDPTTIYFTSLNRHGLVPDLRYLPIAMRGGKQRTEVVDWLLDGPSDWLASSAGTEIPEGTKRRGNVVMENGIVVVNLTSDAGDAGNKNLMAAQFAWTLKPYMQDTIQIRIEGRPVKIPGVAEASYNWRTWAAYNPSAAATGTDGFYVSDGKIMPVNRAVPLPDVIEQAGDRVNSRVRSAALPAGAAMVAVVRDGRAGPELWMGRTIHGRGPATVTFAKADLGHPDSLGEPSFVAESAMVVVPRDGRLVSVQKSGAVGAVDSDQPIRNASAVAVAPDGCRIAYIDGGRLYLASLSRGDTEGRLAIGRPRPVAVGFSQLTDVAWNQETEIVLAGRGSLGDGDVDSHGGAWQFSIDGAIGKALTPPYADTVPEWIGSSIGDLSTWRSPGAVLISSHGKVSQVSDGSLAPPAGTSRAPHGTAPFFPS